MGITRAELESLIERQDGLILSVYLDIDQSQAANLNHRYLAALKDRLRELEQRLPAEQKQEFGNAAQRVVQWVSTHAPRGRTLVVLSHAADSFLWSRELWVRLRTQVRWDNRPYVRPLVEALDEYERYGLVLVNRQQARLLIFHMGEIEERQELSAPVRIRHVKAAGMEHAASTLNIQRKDDEHAHAHLKNVCDALEELAARQPIDRLVLAGPHEVTRELEGLLPKHQQAILVQSIALEMDAGEQHALQQLRAIEEQVERQQEEKLVEQLITRAAKDARAVSGLAATLEAFRLGRILKLVYVYDLSAPGAQCTNCRTLFAENAQSCAYCGASARPVADVVERLVAQVVDSGGGAENVRGAAAALLRPAGSIGAFLRF